MGKFFGKRGKITRRFGINLFGNVKFDRVLSRKPNGPGVHGTIAGRRKLSDYGRQLTEKQRLQIAYGLKEKQFRLIFKEANRRRGITGDNMLFLLESRLDNITYRMGWAPTRAAARQFVSHGHVKVNGRKVNIPSYSTVPGEIITLKDSKKSLSLIERNIDLASVTQHKVADWLEVDNKKFEGRIIRIPMRSEIPTIADEQVVVEFYSK